MTLKNKKLPLVFMFIFILLIPFSVLAKEQEIQLIVDGAEKKIPEDQLPYINSDLRTMVSIRGISESLGISVKWENTKKQATIKNGDSLITLTMGSDEARIDNKVIKIDTKPEMVNGRVYIPLRFISQALGHSVKYEGATKTVSIIKAKPIEKVVSKTGYHIVAKGETLYSISKKYNVSTSEIKRINKLTEDTLYIGQKLLLSEDIKYVVKSGDTLFGISSKHNVSVSDIKKKNNLTSDTLYIGQELIIPNAMKEEETPKETEPPKEEPTVITATVNVSGSLNVRKGPGTSHEKIGTLYNMDVVEVLKTENGWMYVKKDSLVGWVIDDYMIVNDSVPKPTTGKIIMLDAGHGGWDPGSLSGTGVYEAAMTLIYANKMKTELERNGYTVLMTRNNAESCDPDTTDTVVDLKCRVAIANQKNPDLFISVHFNWFYMNTAKGTETYYSSAGFNPSSSKKLAELVHKRIQPAMNSTNRGVKDAGFYVIKYTKMPSILTEAGFLTNSYDLSRIQSATVQEQFAKEFTKAINEYFAK